MELSFFSTHYQLQDLELKVKLKDSTHIESLFLTLWIFFPRTPLSCMSDEIKDSLNITRCQEIAQKESEKKEYHLLEHVAYEIYNALKKELPIHLEIGLQLTKASLPFQKKSFAYFPKKEEEVKKTPKGFNWE